jgi:hypothetical protein
MNFIEYTSVFTYKVSEFSSHVGKQSLQNPYDTFCHHGKWQYLTKYF